MPEELTAEFQVRYLNAAKVVRGVVTLRALSLDMPRMFPPDKLFRLEYRTYKLPQRQRYLHDELTWLLDRLFEPERKWVLQQPFAAKLAEHGAEAIRL